MIKLVIFDLDGTLLNTIKDLGMSANYALQKRGFPTHPIEKYPQMVGNGIEKLIERSLPETQRTREEVLLTKSFFMEYYNDHHADFTQPYKGIYDILRTISKNGILLAVASNKYQYLTQSLIKKFFPDIPFISVLGQQENIPIKPNPYIVQCVLQKTQVGKDETLYVGDSGVDYNTAKNSGVPFIGVTWGFCSRGVLEATGAEHLVDDSDALFELFERLGVLHRKH